MPARRPEAGPLWRLCPDDQLVALFRMGHDEAFRAIHDRYRPRLLAYTRRMLGSRPNAEDALQDVFERAYRALRRDARPVTLRAWLYRIAHNRCLDELRRPTPPPGDVFDVSRRPAPDPPAEAERREDLRRLVCDLGRLPEQQRSALVMREFDGLSHAELADALGIGVPAVKSLLARARMGLVERSEARNATCADIRDELARAVDRGVRMSGRSRRHVRDCDGCRGYQLALRGVQGRLGALSPGHGVLAALAELLGIGGAGTGAAVSAGPSAGGALAAGTVAVGAPIAIKLTAIVCVGAVAAGAAGARAPDLSAAPSPVTHAAHRAAPPRVPDVRSVTVRGATAAPRHQTRPTAAFVAPAPPRDEPVSA